MRGAMELAGKLQIKPGETLCVQNAPKAFRWDGLTDKHPALADAVLYFAVTSADLAGAAGFIDAARDDRVAWLAFPKAGLLGTDLSRDDLVERLKVHGIQSVRVVNIDDTWSAARFRPAA